MGAEPDRYLNLLLAQFCDAYLFLDSGWRALEIQGKVEEIFQHASGDLLEQVFWDVFPQLKDGELYQQTHAAAQAGRPVRISGQLLPWEGWIEVLINPVQGGVELFVRNISTYQQEQGGRAGAEKSRVLFDALLNNIPEGILIADAADTSILVISQYGQEILAIPRGKILHQPFHTLLEQVAFLKPDGVTLIPYQEHPLIRTLEKGDRAEDEDMVLRNAQNSVFHVSTKYGPIHNKNGEIIAGIFSWMDISERRIAEQIQEETARRLASSNQALEAFAYSASHDLQEPIRKIASFSNLLDQAYGSELREDGRELLERIRNASLRMQKMIESLLSFSRISAYPPDLTQVDLNDVLRRVISDMEIKIQRMGARVRVDDLPTVQADPALMENLFLNLIGNALKFQRTGILPEVHIYQAKFDPERKAWVRIIVQDNGIGFDQEHAELIFQPLQRLHGRSDYEGSGLGLAICKMIVEQHGGQITAKSEPGKGSTFLLDLPAR